MTWECHCMAKTKEMWETIRKESKKRRTKVNRNSIIEVYGWLTLEAFRHFIKYVVPDPTRSKTVASQIEEIICEHETDDCFLGDCIRLLASNVFGKWNGVNVLPCAMCMSIEIKFNVQHTHTRHFISLFLCFHFQSSTIRFHSPDIVFPHATHTLYDVLPIFVRDHHHRRQRHY